MSTYGRLFRVTTYGESHGLSVGCIIDGVPPNLEFSESDIQPQLDRRKPNQNSLLSPRSEPDIVSIQSGIQNGLTLGTPICLIVKNVDMKKSDYESFSSIPRPGHADFTYLTKYGIKAASGGGRSSARETISRVAAGCLAEKFLKINFGTEIISWVNSVGNSSIPDDLNMKLIQNPPSRKELDLMSQFDVYEHIDSNDISASSNPFTYENYKVLSNLIFHNPFTNKVFFLHLGDWCHADPDSFSINESKEIESNYQNLKLVSYKNSNYKFRESVITRCPDINTSLKIIQTIIQTKLNLDSVGGTVSCVITNTPQSLGEPCFDKLEAELAKAMLSIPATKGFEIGSGFEGTKLRGSQHNDVFLIKETDKLSELKKNSLSLNNFNGMGCKTNFSGGTLGGISTGENIYFKVAFKPVSTIGLNQETCDYSGKDTILMAKGRHDPCVLPRAMPIVEGMTAIVLMDLALIQASRLNFGNCKSYGLEDV